MRCLLLIVFFLFSVSCSSRIDRAIARADELRGTQQYEAALQAYQQIIDLYDDPKVADAMLRAADLYQFNLNQHDKALAMYKDLLAAWPWQPTAMTAYQRIADLAEARHDHVGAIEALEGLLRYFPSHPERQAMRHRIGTLYLRQKDYRQARIEFFSVLEDAQLPAELRAQVLFDVAESYLLEDAPEEAIVWYEKLIKEFPDHALVHRALAQMAESHMELGEMGIARTLLREAAVEKAAALPTAIVTLHPQDEKPVIVTTEVAKSDAARARGLMYREHLPDGAGMWFVFPKEVEQSFWMKNTFVSLDLIFVNAEDKVVDIIPNTTPKSETPLTAKKPYRYVLEVPAGFAERYKITVGTHVVVKME